MFIFRLYHYLLILVWAYIFEFHSIAILTNLQPVLQFCKVAVPFYEVGFTLEVSYCRFSKMIVWMCVYWFLSYTCNLFEMFMLKSWRILLWLCLFYILLLWNLRLIYHSGSWKCMRLPNFKIACILCDIA